MIEAAAQGAVIGIDLGTSNSAVAVVKDGSPVIIPLEGNRPTIPSIIHFGKVTGVLAFLIIWSFAHAIFKFSMKCCLPHLGTDAALRNALCQ